VPHSKTVGFKATITIASVDGVLERFEKQYGNREGEVYLEAKKKLEALRALRPDAPLNDYVEILGMSWTHPMCHVCLEYVYKVIEFNDTNFCQTCLREALRVLEHE